MNYRTFLLGLTVILLSACGGGGGGSTPLLPPAAPVLVSVEGNDGSVDVLWTADPAATTTALTAIDLDAAPGTPVSQTFENVSPPFRHTGLVNGRRYAYYLVSSNVAGPGPASVQLRAVPGPVPTAPLHTTAVPLADGVDVSWLPSDGVTSYRIHYSDSRSSLAAVRRPATPFVEVAADAVSARMPRAKFYRVQAVNGPRVDVPGQVAFAITFDLVFNDDVTARLRGTVHDWNGDDCPDLPVALGDCTGRFRPIDLQAAGLSSLYANSRASGETRIVDLDGDGDLDFITNVYADAREAFSVALLHVNGGDGTFVEDPAITTMQIGGFGETISVADFDNDEDLDVFLTHYWHRGDGGRNWLLVNQGDAQFEDRAAAAGILSGPPVVGNNFYPYQPEGTQAFDLNEDGLLDLYYGSQMYINNGDLTFTDERATYNLPIRFEEGAYFADVDLDGDLDFVHNSLRFVSLYRNEGGRFGEPVVLGGSDTTLIFGLTVCDINADGYPEVISPGVDEGTGVGRPMVFVNVRGSFVQSDYGTTYARAHDIVGCADIDRNGSADVTVNGSGITTFLASSGAMPHLRVRVLAGDGRQNQYGRTVRVRPLASPGVTMTRVVDGGAGYQTQTDYDVLVAAPWVGEYEVSVHFKGGVQVVRARAGELVTFREGRSDVERAPLPARSR